ncbi:MAG: hypothetical protein CBC44_000175 [Flavobacteriales bacterium TMED84]|nr:MAG: hypothetical protein CBC44_000175 [Flavobacteriales bacterium TMED84]
MRVLYNISLSLIWLIIKAYSLFDKKTKLFVELRKNQKIISKENVVLFHCSSLGEYESIKYFIRIYKEKNKNSSIFLSAFSPSLQRHNIDFNFVDYFFYLPIDLNKTAKKIISLINPKKVFFVKKEIWFNYIFEISKRKIPLYLISGKFKKKDIIFSFNWMINHLKMFDFIFTNDHQSSDVLKSKNINNYIFSGDTRFDSISNSNKVDINQKRINDFCGDKDIIVFGSVYKEDLRIIEDFITKNNSYKYLIAFHNDCKKNNEILKKYDYINYSDNSQNKANILIIDEFGILKKLYKFAKIVYVGGGFNKGVHNILEPIFFGNPVLFGPKFKNFDEAKNAIRLGIAMPVSNKNEFEVSVEKFKNFDRSKSREYFKSNLGASNNIMLELEKQKNEK